MINAFTLAELLVVALLSSIIVIVSFSVIQIMNNELTHFVIDSKEASKIEYLQRLLKEDSFNATKIIREDNQIEFFSHKYQSRYSIHSGFIARELLTDIVYKDTFFIKVKNWNTSFVEGRSLSKLIKVIEIECFLFNDLQKIIITKDYDAKELMYARKTF